MSKLFPVMAVSGSDDFRVRRFIQTVTQNQVRLGWDVLWVTGDNKGELEEALMPDPLGSAPSRLVIISKPENLSLAFLKETAKAPWAGITLLLHCSGDPGKGAFWTFAASLGKTLHRTFPEPKPWDVEKEAIEFCIAEAKAKNKTLSAGLAQSLVVLSGPDLGVLSFELQKLSMLADIDKVTTITENHLVQGRAPLAETSMIRIVDALSAKDTKRLALMLRRVRETRKEVPVMELVGWVMPPVVRWLVGRDLQEKGVPHEQAAAQMGFHGFRYKKEVIERMGRWSKPELVQILRALAEAQRNVVTGILDPWAVLSARLLGLCAGTRAIAG